MSTQTIAVERRRRRGAIVGGAAFYAWVAGHFTPFTWPAAVVTFVPGAIGLALSTRLPRQRERRRGLARTGWIWWVVVLGAVIGLETYGFFGGSSTEGHPTISNIVNHGLHWDLSRGIAFFGWLAFGKWLLER
jgi:hypothetical protein